MPADPEDPREYFRNRGFDVHVEPHDLHAEHMATGELGRATFFVEGRTYYCVDVIRNGGIVAHRYAHGETIEAALAEARRRFGSEQG